MWHILDAMLPRGSAGAKSTPALAMIAVQLMMCAGVVRLRRALEARRMPRWAGRGLRVLPPGAVAALRFDDSEWAIQLQRLWHERGDQQSAVYVLFSHSSAYVGKANMVRSVEHQVWR